MLFKRNRLELIKERDRVNKEFKRQSEKEKILKDILLDEDVQPEMLVEMIQDFEDNFWLEAFDENCPVFEEELQYM